MFLEKLIYFDKAKKIKRHYFTWESNPRPSDNQATAMADRPEDHQLMNSGGNFNYINQDKSIYIK